jgi:polar amino acid transport system substrate-binding protein
MGDQVKAVKRGFVFGTGLLAGLAIADAQQAALKVGYGALNAPTSSLPGATADKFDDVTGNKAQGALIDLVNAIAKDAGFQISFVPFGAGGHGGSGGNGGGYGVGGTGQTAALTGTDIDIIAGAPYSATDPGAAGTLKFAVTKPVYTTSEALLAKKTDTVQYRTWPDLKGQVVGTLADTIADGPLQSSMLFKDVKTYMSLAQIAAAVNSGEVKAAIVPGGPNLVPLVGQGDFANLQVVNTYQPQYVFDVAIGVRMGDPLLAKIDASLAKLKANGMVKTIFAKYGIDSYLTK